MEKMTHTYPEQSRRIVCLGGGNAIPKAVLEGLKKHPEIKISAISAMLDSGGSAGRERELFKTKVAFGDIRRAALALSNVSAKDKERFAYRFENGQVMANIYCTTCAITDGVEELLADLREDLKIPQNYQLFPATLDDAALCAKLDNGEIVRGETNIDVPKHNIYLKINKVFLEPEARAYGPALKAIQEADLIVIGPGDLYSSLAQILLVKGISEAVRKSRAKKVYICNLMTKRGETDNFSVLDFTFEIERYLGQEVDRVVFNRNKSSAIRIANYKKEHPELLELVKFSEILDKGKFIGESILTDSGPIAHHPDKLAKIILNLCKP
ncbi:MAG: YvcK family protein [Candidatus Nealsonbacteria bacterium]|nr:YvcK family protein [Candidatus Nealsonbacteria bacterium]